MAEDSSTRRVKPATPAAGPFGQSHQPTAAPQQSQNGCGGTAAPRRRGCSLSSWVDRSKISRLFSALAPASPQRLIARVRERLPAPRRECPVRLTLPPVEKAADIPTVLEAITAEVRRGSITPAEAAALAALADAQIRAIETREFDRRLRVLEAAHAAQS
jgi:hypothetical protein